MCKTYNDWLPLAHPYLGTWLETQACALTGNQTGNLLVLRVMTPNTLSYISQGPMLISDSKNPLPLRNHFSFSIPTFFGL